MVDEKYQPQNGNYNNNHDNDNSRNNEIHYKDSKCNSFIYS